MSQEHQAGQQRQAGTDHRYGVAATIMLALLLAVVFGSQAQASSSEVETIRHESNRATPGKTRIVVGRSIGGISIGQTMAEVRRERGRPTSDNYGRGGSLVGWSYGNPRNLSVEFGDRVTDVTGWNDLPYKTDKGVGIGSSLAQIQKAYPRAVCTSDPSITGVVGLPPNAPPIECVIHSTNNGRTIDTMFIAPDPARGVTAIGIGWSHPDFF